MKNRNTTIIATLALTAAALASTIASAAGFGGNFVVPGPLRVVSTLTQITGIGALASLPIKVTTCLGPVEIPVFHIVAANTVIANGSCYQIIGTLIGPNTTHFDVIHTTASNGLLSIELGGATQMVLFDRALPNPGTQYSLSGLDVTYTGGNGAWILNAVYSGPVELGTRPIMNDVYNKLTLRFSACFDTGDSVSFDVDTDSIG
ncbi:MAG: hypothetical protein WCI96_12400 [Planctomycetota bacterium]